MASHVITFRTFEEFFKSINGRDRSLIVKMTKSILYAIKHKRPKIDIFEVLFKDPDEHELIFTKHKKEYIPTLKEVMPFLIEFEEYELCAEIKTILNKHNAN